MGSGEVIIPKKEYFTCIRRKIYILSFAFLFLIWYILYTKIYIHADITTGFLGFMSDLSSKDQMSIMNRIAHIRDVCAGKPVPPTAKPLHDIGGEDLSEIRVTLSDGLLARIHYFADTDSDTLVVLNAYTKPNGSKDKNSYNKAKHRTLEQKIQGHIAEAIELKKRYITNPEYYELLN